MIRLLLAATLIATVNGGLAKEGRVKTPIKPHQQVLEHVLKNKPTLDKVYADKLAKAIYAVSSKHHVNPIKISAILRQECGYKLKCINAISKDYGIGQINHKTIKAFNFDKQKLLTDLNYSVEAAAIVLSDFKKRYAHKEKDFWTRYNSSNKEKREKYRKLVARYL